MPLEPLSNLWTYSGIPWSPPYRGFLNCSSRSLQGGAMCVLLLGFCLLTRPTATSWLGHHPPGPSPLTPATGHPPNLARPIHKSNCCFHFSGVNFSLSCQLCAPTDRYQLIEPRSRGTRSLCHLINKRNLQCPTNYDPFASNFPAH